jgi:hypothetical protein
MAGQLGVWDHFAEQVISKFIFLNPSLIQAQSSAIGRLKRPRNSGINNFIPLITQLLFIPLLLCLDSPKPWHVS